MISDVTSYRRLPRFRTVPRHVYCLPVVRELPAPPPAAGTTTITW